jgi:thymidylate synthase/dihydrofolate reductase
MSETKFDIILAVDSEGGTWKDGKLPLRCSEDLSIFCTKNANYVLIVGRDTFDKIPLLEGMYMICVSHCSTFEKALEHAAGMTEYSKILFVGGGDILNNYVMKTHGDKIDTVHMYVFHDKYEAGTFSTIDLSDFAIQRTIKAHMFDHHELTRASAHGEKQYLDLITHVMNNGDFRSATRNGSVTSSFGHNMKFDLREGFPLLTTKRVFWRAIVEELLMFLRGDTDTKTALEDKKINIWKMNTTSKFLEDQGLPYEEGDMGPMYGYQWRHFNSVYTQRSPVGGVDQLKKVVDLIRSEPESRRIIMTSFNPEQAEEGVLYPCHSLIIQFYVVNGYIDMVCYNRSQDLFLGVPFNIASSALLLSIVAKMTGYLPRYLHMNMGDCHIYPGHSKAVVEQLSKKRIPFKFPSVSIPEIGTIEDLNTLTFESFTLNDYKNHGPITAEMVA